MTEARRLAGHPVTPGWLASPHGAGRKGKGNKIMSEFRVTWSIDLDADNPGEAARLAAASLTDPDSIGYVFDVSDGTRLTRVDLTYGTETLLSDQSGVNDPGEDADGLTPEQSAFFYSPYPDEEDHPADCDGTVESPHEGFGGQPVTGTCRHPSHGRYCAEGGAGNADT